MTNQTQSERAFIELNVKGASEFGEAWYYMNRYLVSLARSYKVDYKAFKMQIAEMALDGLRKRRYNHTAADFLHMVTAPQPGMSTQTVPLNA